MSGRVLIVTNFVLFQAGWFACVLMAGTEFHWLATLCVAGVVYLHCRMAGAALSELKLVMIALLVGLLWESLLVNLEVLQYPQGQLHGDLAPHWIVAMWALFATQLNVSMRWLKDRLYLALLFGAIGGPLSFMAGAKLDAVVMPEQVTAILMLSIGWAVLMPAMMLVSKYFDGFQQRGEIYVR